VFGGVEHGCGWDSPTSTCRRGFVTSAEERAARHESVPGGCVASSSDIDDDGGGGSDRTTMWLVVGIVAMAAIGIGAFALGKCSKKSLQVPLPSTTSNPTWVPVEYPTGARRGTLSRDQEEASTAPDGPNGDAPAAPPPTTADGAPASTSAYDVASYARFQAAPAGTATTEPQYAEVADPQYERPADLRATDENGYATSGMLGRQQSSA
jgi:hypothetical protein